MTSTEVETKPDTWTPHHGAFIWGKWRNQRLWWPGIIVGASHCLMKQTKVGHEWVFWFGDHSVSAVPGKNLCEFVPNFRDKYNSCRNPLYFAGVVEAIKECKTRVEKELEKQCKCDVKMEAGKKKCKCRLQVIKGNYVTEPELLSWAYKDFALPNGSVDYDYYTPDPTHPIPHGIANDIKLARTKSKDQLKNDPAPKVAEKKATNAKSAVAERDVRLPLRRNRVTEATPDPRGDGKQLRRREHWTHNGEIATKRGEPSRRSTRQMKTAAPIVVETSTCEEPEKGEKMLIDKEDIKYDYDEKMLPDGSNEDSIITAAVQQLTDLNNLQNYRIREKERISHNENGYGISSRIQCANGNREPNPPGSSFSGNPLPTGSAVESLNTLLMNERTIQETPHQGVNEFNDTFETVTIEAIKILEQKCNENVNCRGDARPAHDHPDATVATRNSGEPMNISKSPLVRKDGSWHDERFTLGGGNNDGRANYIKSPCKRKQEEKLDDSVPQNYKISRGSKISRGVQPVVRLEMINVSDDGQIIRAGQTNPAVSTEKNAEAVTSKYSLSRRIRRSVLTDDHPVNALKDKTEMGGCNESNMKTGHVSQSVCEEIPKDTNNSLEKDALPRTEEIEKANSRIRNSPAKPRTNVDDAHQLDGAKAVVADGNAGSQSNTITETWSAGVSQASSSTEKDYPRHQARSHEDRDSKTEEAHKKEMIIDYRKDESVKVHQHEEQRSSIQKKTVSGVQDSGKKAKEDGRRTDKTNATKPHSSTSKLGSDRVQHVDNPLKHKEGMAHRKWTGSEAGKASSKRKQEVPGESAGKTSSMTHSEFLRQRFMNEGEGSAVDKVRAHHLKIDDICIACRVLSAEPSECHPFFDGGICEKCRKKIIKTLYVCGEDGTSRHCIICSEAKQVITCSKRTCNSTFCKKCLKALAGPEEVEMILGSDLTVWRCYLCRDDYEKVDLLSKRNGWQRYVIKLYSPFYYISHKNVSYKIREMRVLSVFDGIGTGLYVLDKLGLKIERYLAAENDADAQCVTALKFGDRIRPLGPVENVSSAELDRLGQIDLVIANIPYTAAETPQAAADIMNMFHEYHRILRYVQIRNNGHQVFWLFECMTMEKKDQDIMSRFLECEPVNLDPVMIPNTYFGRSFWGNIPGLRATLCPEKLAPRLSLQEFLVGGSKPRLTAEDTCMLLTVPEPLSGGPPINDGRFFPCGTTEFKSNALYPMQWFSEMVTAYGMNSQLADLNRLSMGTCRRLLRRASSALVTVHILRTLTHFFSCVDEDD